MAQKAKLPAGIEMRRGRVIVDATVTIVQLSPGLVLLARPANRRSVAMQQSQNGFAWASCTCSKAGGCKVELKPLPGGSKAEVQCSTGTCKGSCTAHAGEIPKGAAFAKAFLAALPPATVAAG